ncbi:MAG: hypothetical protein R3B99_11090 [Polyangiales bacterium]
MNVRTWKALALAAAMAGCGGESTVGIDAGRDAGEAGDAGGSDSGVDAGADGGLDAGEDDGGVDGGVDAGPSTTTEVSLDFEGELPSFVTTACDGTPSQGYAPLGPEGHQFGPTFLRCLTGSTITITLTDLPEHTSLDLDFLFAAIDSLDGEGTFPAGDFFRVDLDGTTIFREAFANATPSQIQTYEPPVPEIVLARRVDLGFSGPGGFYTDSAYDLSLDPIFDGLPHTASTATFVFTLEGEGVQSLEDESWAIDEVRVLLNRD